MTKLIIFDLDGTLLDTLGDLAVACNAVLALRGLPQHSLEEYRRFVGNGIMRLVERALPEPLRNPYTVEAARRISSPTIRTTSMPAPPLMPGFRNCWPNCTPAACAYWPSPRTSSRPARRSWCGSFSRYPLRGRLGTAARRAAQARPCRRSRHSAPDRSFGRRGGARGRFGNRRAGGPCGRYPVGGGDLGVPQPRRAGRSGGRCHHRSPGPAAGPFGLLIGLSIGAMSGRP